MQHDAKVGGTHRPSTELAIHAPLTRLPVILLQVHDKAAQQLKHRLHILFDNADATLFEMADKARNNAEQSLFFEAMRDVRLKRKNIERGFLERLLKAFIRLTQPVVGGPDVLAAAVPHVLSRPGGECAQVINGMVAQVLIRDQLALCQLSTGLNTLSGIPLDEQSNPLGPAMLCEYFLQAEREQGMQIKVKLIMLQLFEKYLLSHTGQLYADANQLLSATGVLPDRLPVTACCASAPTQYERPPPITGDSAGNVVQLLFEYIDGDRNLSLPLKKLIGALQEPMLKIAQRDQSFFSSDSHPARRLLNVMAKAAIGWDSSINCSVDPLHRQMGRVVQQLASCPSHNPALLESLLHDVLLLARAERERMRVLEQRICNDGLASALQKPINRPWLAPVLTAPSFVEQDSFGLLMVSQLRVGCWIDQRDHQGRRLRCKLIAIVEPEGRYVFVNCSGVRALEKGRADLIFQLRSGMIVLLDNSLLFDRALASIVDSLGPSGAQ